MQYLKPKSQIIIGYFLAAIAFFLPLKAQFATIFIIIALVAALITADWKSVSNDLKKNKFFIVSIAYFTLHLIGMCYSTNLDYGFKDIQTKLSFLIFPLLFILYKPDLISIGRIKKSFIAGCIVALIICMVKSAIDYSITHDTNVFFYTAFSQLMHPTYFGFYLNLALIFLIDEAYSSKESFGIKSLIPFFATELFLFTGLFLLSARMSLSVTILTIIILVIFKAIQQKQKRKLSFALALSFLIAGGIQYELANLYNRFAQIETAIQNEKQIISDIKSNSAKSEEYNSTTSRLALWKYSSELITSTPRIFLVGVGTGDIKEELRKVYVENHFQKGIDENYNPHNQFLHTAVVIGIFGMLLLLILLLSPWIAALKKNSLPLSMFLIIVLLNGLTESILEVQSGIIFFCFFYCLLITEMNLNKRLE